MSVSLRASETVHLPIEMNSRAVPLRSTLIERISGVAALFEFVFERQFQQGRQRHFRVEVLQHLAGHFGIFAVRLAFDDFDQVVLDLGLF